MALLPVTCFSQSGLDVTLENSVMSVMVDEVSGANTLRLHSLSRQRFSK